MPLDNKLNMLSVVLFLLLQSCDAWSEDDQAPASIETQSASLSNLSSLSGRVPASFSANYKLYYKWMKMGEGKYVFSKNKALKQPLYRFALSTKMRFLFFTDRRTITSDFMLKEGVIFPQLYQHSREGTGADYSEQVSFDWGKRAVDAKFHKKSYQLDLTSAEKPIEGQAALNSYITVLDGLAVQFQLFLDVRESAGQSSYLYPIIEPYGLMERSFELSGRENIELEVNGEDITLDCAVYSVKRQQKKFKTLMYFAKELGYLPVQLVHYSDGKKQFSAILSAFDAENNN
ncbi:MAG: DUF3108 domain-containing protein [Sinobacterium sp.]|nr:DUF3108 domain-containing protein [Sinobacterium sp.]